MPFLPGFHSEAQRERFLAAAALVRRGGPLARTCGAKLRTGGVCTQLAMSGEGRCLRHGGPDAARRFRERQKAAFERGAVSADEWARAEAKRARNALIMAWRKDPRLPGRTIDLGPDEVAFATSAADAGVDVDVLYPAQADWLRWKWRRHQKDRPDAARWLRAVRDDLPRQRAAADAAVALADLGITDKRTVEARAAKAALRAGGVAAARVAVDALRAASSASVDAGAGKGGPSPAGPLTRLPVRPWTPRPAGNGWKRRKPDRTKAPSFVSGPPKPVGRPRRVPDSPDELAALADVLRAAGPRVRTMYGTLSDHKDQLRFLRDLSAYGNAPDDPGALRRWTRWVHG